MTDGRCGCMLSGVCDHRQRDLIIGQFNYWIIRSFLFTIQSKFNRRLPIPSSVETVRNRSFHNLK